MNQKQTVSEIKLARVLCVMLTVIFIMSLTACKSREPVTAEVFKETLAKLEYEVVDATEESAEHSHILKVLRYEDESLHIEFIEVDGNDNAIGVFNSNKENIESFKGSASSSETGNYQKYSSKTSDNYYLVERIGATIIYAFCDKAESEKLDGIIKELEHTEKDREMGYLGRRLLGKFSE